MTELASPVHYRNPEDGLEPSHFHDGESQKPPKASRLRSVGHIALIDGRHPKPIGPERPSDPIFGEYRTPAEDAELLREFQAAQVSLVEKEVASLDLNLAELTAEAKKRPSVVAARVAADVLRTFDDRRITTGGAEYVDFVDDRSPENNSKARRGNDSRPVAVEVAKMTNSNGTQQVEIVDNRTHLNGTSIHVLTTPNEFGSLEVMVQDLLRGSERVIEDPAEKATYLETVLTDVVETVKTASGRDTPQARALAMRHVGGNNPSVPWSRDEREHLRQGLPNLTAEQRQASGQEAFNFRGRNPGAHR